MESDVNIWTVNIEPETTGSPQDTPNPPEYNVPESLPPPPSYELLYGREVPVHEEYPKDAEEEKYSCIKHFCNHPAWLLFVLLFLLAVPTACLIMGVHYIDDCPIQPNIPIYLIVTGCVGYVLLSVPLSKLWKKVQCCCREDLDAEQDPSKQARVFAVCMGTYTVMISCFMPIWLIAGSVWVYSIYGDYQSDDPDGDDYCHQTLYLFAFWLITAKYMLICVHIIVTIVMAVVIICREI